MAWNRVDYLRSSVPCNGTFERIYAVWRIEWVVQAPAHNALWCEVIVFKPVLKSGSIIKMVIDMVNNAMKKIPNHEGLILHSDQWWHYQHVKYQNTLKKNGIEQSMSRKGNCLDNAMMENFFRIMKTELLYSRQWNIMDELQKELRKYIYYYNHERIKLRLNGMSPEQYRTYCIK